MTTSSHALSFELLGLIQGKGGKIDAYYKSGMVHPIVGQMYSDSSRCVDERKEVDILNRTVLDTSIRRHPGSARSSHPLGKG